MIKNILYSLFLHSLLALAVYASFRTHISEEKITLKDGLTVGIASLASIEKPSAIEKTIADSGDEKNATKTTKPKQKIEKKVAKSATKEPDITTKSVKTKNPKNSKNIAKALNDKNNKFKKTDDDKTIETIAEKIEDKPVEPKPEPKPDEEIASKEEPTTKEESANKEESIGEKTGAEKIESQPEIIADIVDDLEILNLSAREKFNIQSQLRACYKRAIMGEEKNNLVVVVKVKVLQDGTIDFDQEEIIDAKRYNNSKEVNYKNRMNDVLETLELCSPLRNLPMDKYDVWREFTIEFGEE